MESLFANDTERLLDTAIDALGEIDWQDQKVEDAIIDALFALCRARRAIRDSKGRPWPRKEVE